MQPADFLLTLFSIKLTEDNRNPWWLEDDFAGYRIGFLVPKAEFQTQMLLLINGQIAIALLFGFTTWHCIIHPIQARKDGTIPIHSLLIGLGLLIPLSLMLPFLVFDAIDLRSIPLRFGCFFIPLILPCKVLDALFGVDSMARRTRMASLRHYLYYSFQIMPTYSHKNDGDEVLAKHKRIVVPCTLQSFSQNFMQFIKWFLVSILVNQMLSPFDFAPFPEKNHARNRATDLYPTFELCRLCNNYLQFLAF
jgi:hypothetical protein